jgi:hypothetical protein
MPESWFKQRITFHHLALIHAFLAIGFGWGLSIVFFPSTSYVGVVNPLLVIQMGSFVLLGGVLAAVGLFMTRAYKLIIQHVGLWIETLGTVLMAGGILQYLSIQVGYLVSEGFDVRYNLFWLSYSLMAFAAVRFSVLIPALINANRAAKLNMETPSLRLNR